MLPRYNSQENQVEKSLLPRFDENQSAQARSLSIKFLEKTYDRSGKRCWPLINTNIVHFDLERTYEIVSNSLESYITYRKLDRCKALANFIDYREKIYKREKLGQYAVKQTIQEVKTIPSKEPADRQEKIVTPISPTIVSEISPTPSTHSIISEKLPPSESISQESFSPKRSTTQETLIPIPSSNLLQKPSLKQKRLAIPKKNKNNLKQVGQLTPLKTKRKSTNKSCVIL